MHGTPRGPALTGRSPRRQFGMCSKFPENTIAFALGALTIGGTLAVVIVSVGSARGVVATTWLGGKAAPAVRCAHIRSSASMK